jgi:cytidine deaminase
MTTSKQFLDLAKNFLIENDDVCAALYADSAQWAANTFLSDTSPNMIASLAASLPKPLWEYTTLFNRAIELALETRTRAHAPFSNFLVGATLIADDESLHIGCNVECSSYGLTICAERTALVSAVAQGKKRFVGIVVAAETNTLTPPCGACRQLLYDFAPNAVVVLVNTHGAQKRFTMNELLPEAFTVAFLR